MTPLKRIDPRVIFDAIWRRLLLVLTCGVLATGGGAGASKVIKPKNESSAKLMIQDHDMVNPFLKDLMVDWTVKKRLPVITNIVRSRQTAERVQRELGFLHEGSTPEEIDTAVKAYQKRVTIFGLGGGVVQIKYRGASPDDALNAINLVVQIFTEEMLRPQKRALDSSVDFLASQLERVREDLDEKEDELRKFKEEHATELPEVYKANLDAYLDAQRQRMEASAELGARRQQLRIAKERLVSYDPVSRRVESELADAKGELATLLAALKPDHPKARAAKARVAKLENELKRARANRKTSTPGSLEHLADGSGDRRSGGDGPGDLLTGDLLDYREASSEVGALAQRVQLLDAEAKKAIDRTRSFASHARTLRALQRDIDAKSKSYLELLKRHEDAVVTRSLTLQGEASKVWVIERPTRPSGKKPFPWFVLAIGGLLGGLILGLGVSLGLEIFDPTARTSAQAADATSAPLLATLPALECEP